LKRSLPSEKPFLEATRSIIQSIARQNRAERLFFVILVTQPKSYTKTTDRRDFGANRQSGGEDGCYREKSRNFVAWVEPDTKNSIFRVFRVPFDYPAHSLQETVYPKPMVPMESGDSEGVSFASLESL